MQLTEVQKIFISEKIQTLLPGSKIYLFYTCGKDLEKQGEVDLIIFAQRELSLQEKNDIRNSFWRLLGDQNLNIVSYKNDNDSSYVNYILTEGIEL